MAKKLDFIGMLLWIVGIIVTLAVGFGMISETLVVPNIPSIIVIGAGWVVVIGAILGVVMAAVKKFG